MPAISTAFSFACRQQLSNNFVRASGKSSPSGGGTFSNIMEDNDARSDDVYHADSSSAGDQPVVHHGHQDLRDQVTDLRSTVVKMSNRIQEQEQQLQAQQTDDVTILAHASAAVKQSIANAYKEAAAEQYRAGDLLMQKAAKLDPDTTGPVAQISSTPRQSIKQFKEVSEVNFTTCATTVTPDTPAEDKADASTTTWMPVAIRELTPVKLNLTAAELETFTWETITRTLGGYMWSPNFYYVSKPNDDFNNVCTSYWMLEGHLEPFAPTEPGMHGAKLTALIRPFAGEGDEPGPEHYYDVPVFLSKEEDGEFIYMGHYTQNRFSDKLDHDTQQRVPGHVLYYWANQLTSRDRAPWVLEELRQSFWPKPTYKGPLPTDSAVGTPATPATGIQGLNADAIERHMAEAMAEYVDELKDWSRESEMRLARLTSGAIMTAFKAADTQDPPGLRLFWEYLEFVHWDKDFYEDLLKYRHGINAHAPETKSKGEEKVKKAGPQDQVSLLFPHHGAANQSASISTVDQDGFPGPPGAVDSDKTAAGSGTFKTCKAAAGPETFNTSKAAAGKQRAQQDESILPGGTTMTSNKTTAAAEHQYPQKRELVVPGGTSTNSGKRAAADNAADKPRIPPHLRGLLAKGGLDEVLQSRSGTPSQAGAQKAVEKHHLPPHMRHKK